MTIYKKQLQNKSVDDLEEGWRSNVAAAAMTGMMGLSGAAGAQDRQPEPVKEPIIATVVIDGEARRLDLTPKGFDDVKEAERFLKKFLADRGIKDWQAKIERSTPGTGRYERLTISGMGGLESLSNEDIRRVKSNTQTESLRSLKKITKENNMSESKIIFESIKSLLFEKTLTLTNKTYKKYTIRVVYKKGEGYGGIAFRQHHENIDQFIIRGKKTAQEVEKGLMDYVDSKRRLPDNSLKQFKSGNITLFFNSILSREIFGPDTTLYADIEKINDNPVLIFSNEDQGGMIKVYDRNINKTTGRGVGVFVIPKKKAIDSGLTLSRYDLGKEIDYGVDDVVAYELEWNSDVLPDESIKLGGPGLTVSPPEKGRDMAEAELMIKTFMILEDMERFRMLAELKKPSGTATLKFQIKPDGQLFAFIGLGNDPKEIRVAKAVIPETRLSSPNDLNELIQKVLKDPFYNFEIIKVIVTKALEKNYPKMVSALDQSKERFGDRVEVKKHIPEPTGGGGIRRKKPKIQYTYKPYESPVKEFDPKNMKVKFDVSDSAIERLFRGQGLNYQNGSFIIPYETYKKLIDILKSPEMISRFGKRDIISNKTFIEGIDDEV